MNTFQCYAFHLISLYVILVSSQNKNISLDYFCLRAGHSSIKVGDAVYVLGGSNDRRIFNTTYSYDSSVVRLDVSYSWNPVDNDQPATYVSPPNPFNDPFTSLVESGIFFSNNTFHIYGGGLVTLNASANQHMISTSVRNDIRTFSNDKSIWSSARIQELNSTYAPMHALSVVAPEHNLFFYFNGILSNGSSESAFPHMMIINTQTKKVKIVSTKSISLDTIRVGAVLQYLPLMGTRGALILFGGATKHNDNITDPWGTMVPVDTVHIFDIASLDNTPDGVWYTQRTSGRTPRPRISSCAVNIPSPDNTSYHIYTSSGRSPNETHDDVWVLSVPQFHWTQVFSGARPNYGSACQLVGNKQMLVIGGRDSRTNCKGSARLPLFDLTNLKWVRSYDRNDTAYRVPKAVWERIGGSAMGEARVREPERGFSSIGLARMFDGMSRERGSENTALATTCRNSCWNVGVIIACMTGAFLLL